MRLRSILILLLILSMLALPSFSWKIDGICERDLGESCVNSPDCKSCLVSLDASTQDFGSKVRLTATVKNLEPATLELVIRIYDESTEIYENGFSIAPKDTKVFYVDVNKQNFRRKVYIKVDDAEKDVSWAFVTVEVPGLREIPHAKIDVEKYKEIFYVAIPAAMILLVAFILFDIFRHKEAPKYSITAKQAPTTTVVPQPYIYVMPSQVVVKQGIVTYKKKKYYYKKKKK